MSLDNYQDVIDSRDVIARIEELESLVNDEDSPLDDDETDELKLLQSLAEDASGSPDWVYGETLIRDSYFAEYAQELAEDCGYLDQAGSDRWPFTCIDWEKAARELQQDYYLVNFGSTEYWIRS